MFQVVSNDFPNYWNLQEVEHPKFKHGTNFQVCLIFYYFYLKEITLNYNSSYPLETFQKR